MTDIESDRVEPTSRTAAFTMKPKTAKQAIVARA